jgi:hypothetical protein
MNKVFKFGVLVALAVALVGGYGVFTAKAATGLRSTAVAVHNGTEDVSPNFSTGTESLKNTRFVFGDKSGLSLPAGSFTFIDGVSYFCPGFGSCTYSAEEWAQIFNSSSNNWAIATTVDGVFMSGGGPFLGQPTIGDFSANSWSEHSGHVGPGFHSVLTFIFMRDNPATAFNYNFNYRVYKP